MVQYFAYIGPGTGFAFLGSFLSLAVSLLLAGGALLVWPFRSLFAAIRRSRSLRKAKVRRVIFLGLDGLDPGLVERFMAEGKLPNFLRMREEGSFHRLRTTFPALSPVAWSTFATGVHPAKHNIFDFLNRSLKDYVPELSSSRVRPPARVWRIGKWRLPFGRPVVEMRRKSESFWTILGRHAVSSTVLRVPITFPPEDFNGRMLSAMATPDLRGTQGSFTLFSTRQQPGEREGGLIRPLMRVSEGFRSELEGPEDAGASLKVPFRLKVGSGFELEIGADRVALTPGVYSEWVRITFDGGPGVKVPGIARFLLTEVSPDLSLYVTPIQIDPESPALPISHPSYYSAYLAKLLGRFATAGMAEDTWALNEGAIGEDDFLAQAYGIFDERVAMFENALATSKRGVVACVFDTSDRVQHMFFRHMDGRGDARWAGVIEDMYRRMDALVGRALAEVDNDTILFALSDHGFCAFERSVDLNRWLLENGYLVMKNGATSGRYFEGVDWSRTRAYCMGLSGLYLNLKGREACGIVTKDEAEKLKMELISRLSGLRDDERGQIAIRSVYATGKLYRGPYLAAAPDLIVGYNAGYRVAWDAAVGKIGACTIEDNPKAWSGDHCVDPELVPGVLFCTRKIDAENPGIEDMAPTALNLFGVETPGWMDGRVLSLGTDVQA